MANLLGWAGLCSGGGHLSAGADSDSGRSAGLNELTQGKLIAMG